MTIRIRIPAIGLVGALLAIIGCGGSRTSTPEPTAKPDQATAAVAAPKEGKRRHVGDTPFERSWDLTLPSKALRSWVCPEIPDLLFVQVEEGNAIYAIDAMSGRTRWISLPLPAPLKVDASAARLVLPTGKSGETTNDDRLYLVSDDVLYCLDSVYGQVIWRHALDFSPASAPRAVGVEGGLRVLVGDWAGRIQVITQDPAKGFAWRAWQYQLSAPVTAQPLAVENQIFVTDHGGKLSSFDLDRNLKWQVQLGGRIPGGSDAAARVVYTGTSDGVLYAHNRLSGEELLRQHLVGPVLRAPFHFNGDPETIYVWTDHDDTSRGGLHAFSVKADQIELAHNLDAQNRPRKKEILRLSPRFELPGAKQLVASTPEYLFVTGVEPFVVKALNRRTGAVDWSLDLNEGLDRERTIEQLTTYFDPTDQNRSIFTIDGNNRIVAWRVFGYRPGTEPIKAAPAGAAAKK